MLRFDPLKQNFSSNRFCLASSRGMTATSSALAAEAGAKMLRKGGNAVDAAVAMAAALTVVEPTANGIGSDNFALLSMNGKISGMRSQGASPYGLSLEQLQSLSQAMPKRGWLSVTVPGAPAGWAYLNEKFGRLRLLDCLEPAISYGREGFALSATVAYFWKKDAEEFLSLSRKDPAFLPWLKTFLPGGKAPQSFEKIRLEEHANTLEIIGKTKAQDFYQGDLAKKIVHQSKRDGGFLSLKDLEDHRAEGVRPLRLNYRGKEVYELPPSNQGLVALIALNILNSFSFEKRDENYYHLLMEALKLAFADGREYITDPAWMRLPPDVFLDPAYGRKRAEEIGESAQLFSWGRPAGTNTVYLAAGDQEGNLVSMIQSNYQGFGSGIVIEGTGISLQNRGADFSLDPHHCNVYAPHKKTYHTLIPGMLAEEGKAIAAFGVMGAYMQPQGHVQVLSHLLDFHENPQMALDAPRLQWLEKKRFYMEKTFPEKLVEDLRKRGHEIEIPAMPMTFGRGQIIYKNPQGVLIGGTESRTDGNIALA